MPSYASLDDLRARFSERELIQLTDDTNVDEIDQVRIEQALTSATGIIDSYLAARYALPLARVPEVLVDIACDIARHKLYRDTPPDGVKSNSDRAIRALEQISKGIMKIDAGAPEQTARDGAVLIGEGDALFTRDKLRGF